VTLRSPAADACGAADEHCITCSDEAVPVTVVAVDAERELALCETADGRRETIEIALVSPVRPAECLLAHAGTAIGRRGGV
jgi:hydrogenase maturation factor